MALEEIPCPHCNKLDKATIPGKVVNTFKESNPGAGGKTVQFLKGNHHKEVECSHCGKKYTVEYE